MIDTRELTVVINYIKNILMTIKITVILVILAIILWLVIIWYYALQPLYADQAKSKVQLYLLDTHSTAKYLDWVKLDTNYILIPLWTYEWLVRYNDIPPEWVDYSRVWPIYLWDHVFFVNKYRARACDHDRVSGRVTCNGKHIYDFDCTNTAPIEQMWECYQYQTDKDLLSR